MSEYKTPILIRNNFSILNSSQEHSRHQIDERVRYVQHSRHQPDQASHKSFESTSTGDKLGLRLTEANQGLKELQEKINGALKRSSSATSIRSPQQNIYTNPLVTALNKTQQKVQRTYQNDVTNITNDTTTMESFSDPKSLMNTGNSFTSTVKILPNDISFLPRERVQVFSTQTPQASSTNFYLGGLSQNGRTKEELLNSVKNYQVKTVHTLDSSRKHYSSQNTTQTIPEKVNYVQPQPYHQHQPSGSSIRLKNFTTQTEFQPGYDKDKLDSMILKIVHAQHNHAPTRQDSFTSTAKTVNVTKYESLANSRVYEPRASKQSDRREVPTQQYYLARPLQTVVNKTPVRTVYQKSVNEKKASVTKQSCCGDFLPDGDSMCDFIKENDDLLDFEEEVKPKKIVKEVVEQENLFVRKVPKRQEIMNSKKQVRREPQSEQSTYRQKKEISYKSQASELPPKAKKRLY